jgi:hypothetical protein
MALDIDTFDNVRGGGNALYKALAHPHAAAPARALIAALAAAAPTAIVDPDGAATGFAAMFAPDSIVTDVAGLYVQDAARIGERLLGQCARPLTDLAKSSARSVFVAAFNAQRLIDRLRPLLPKGAPVVSLDAMRIPEERLTNRARYLDPLNFATNFALFRDTGALHTRLVTANYWSAYGASEAACWLTLFDGDGRVLADWREPCGRPGAAIVIDSRDVRRRFDLGDFAGQLFIHIAGAAGHDIVKYALDTFGEPGRAADGGLSCTHDANAWPAERYAGLPAPGAGERVILWLQNSHPMPIPAGAIGLNPMGEDAAIAWLHEPIAPFASRAVDVAELLPGLHWPHQIEVRAGKHVVRPRYEVVMAGAARRQRIAHVNVERGDLRPDPALPRLGEWLGKGYLLPAPILPPAEWRSELLPTPMATTQAELPIAVLAYDADGNEIARIPLGRLPRGHSTALSLDPIANRLGDSHGHVELIYDFADGGGSGSGSGSGDGWLHAIFRYRHLASGHAAETSFGAHVFNTLMVYKGEPQSYSGSPPGLSTRLFLRLGDEPYDTLCQLIYPASLPWRRESATQIILHDRGGAEIARTRLAIPCSGSRLFRYRALFDEDARRRAGDGGSGAYIIVRDTTCRLFGYHGLLGHGGAFSLDHMFGF